jgi:hypothetical protein
MGCCEVELAELSFEASRGYFARGGFLALNLEPRYFVKRRKIKDKGERRA